MTATSDEGRYATDNFDESAKPVEESAVPQIDGADRRTEFAADRTVLAAERTYAAWMRTGLAALAAGVGAKALLQGIVQSWLVALAGTLLILFSVMCFVAAVWREMMPRIVLPVSTTHRMPPAFLLVVNGLLVLLSLAALIGVWIAR